MLNPSGFGSFHGGDHIRFDIGDLRRSHNKRLLDALEGWSKRFWLAKNEREAFAEKFRASGFETAKAESLAWTVNAAIEGAIILSRTFHSGNPLREAAGQLACLIRRCH